MFTFCLGGGRVEANPQPGLLADPEAEKLRIAAGKNIPSNFQYLADFILNAFPLRGRVFSVSNAATEAVPEIYDRAINSNAGTT